MDETASRHNETSTFNIHNTSTTLRATNTNPQPSPQHVIDAYIKQITICRIQLFKSTFTKTHTHILIVIRNQFPYCLLHKIKYWNIPNYPYVEKNDGTLFATNEKKNKKKSRKKLTSCQQTPISYPYSFFFFSFISQ